MLIRHSGERACRAFVKRPMSMPADARRTCLRSAVLATLLSFALTDFGLAADQSIHQAAKTGDLQAIEDALERGVSVDARLAADNDLGLPTGATPLMAAASAGRVEAVRLLLTRGADVNAPARNGSVALLWAAHSESPKVVSMLLEAGADPWAGPEVDVTPFFFAIQSGSPAILKEFLDAGVDPNVRMPGKTTPLMVAADHPHPQSLRLLIERGVNIDLVNHQGVSALMRSARAGYCENVRVLLEAGASVEITDAHGRTALIHAAETGAHCALRALLEAGAKVDSRDKKERTVLMRAVDWGTKTGNPVKCAESLLDAGADPNARGPNGWTPLMFAARSGRPRFVSFLLEAGAKINARNDRGWTPLMIAVVAGQRARVVEWVEREHGDRLPSRSRKLLGMLAVWARPPDVVRTLLDGCAQPDLKNDEDLSALDLAEHRADRHADEVIGALKAKLNRE